MDTLILSVKHFLCVCFSFKARGKRRPKTQTKTRLILACLSIETIARALLRTIGRVLIEKRTQKMFKRKY